MGRMMKCDRCGKVYEPYKQMDAILGERFIELYLTNGISPSSRMEGTDDVLTNINYRYDLCEDCMLKLVAWMEEGKDKDNQE